MTQRREFLQSSVLAMAAALVMPKAIAKIQGDTLSLYKVVFDERHASANAFAMHAKRLGADVHAIQGNVHDLWYHDLYHRWQEAPVAIAGMTHYNAMFLLAMQAQDMGMRVVYRMHHRADVRGVMSHEAFGPYAVLQSATALHNLQTQWAQVAANQVMRWPADAVSVSKSKSNIGAANLKAIDADTLVSWIIAPVLRT